MKRKLLSAAVSAIALAGFSLAPQAVATTTSSAYDVYLAGSSAQDSFVFGQIAGLCGSNAVTVYYDNGGNTLNSQAGSATVAKAIYGLNYKVFDCVVGTAKYGLNVGDNVTFHKVNLGGSAQGVVPIFTNTNVNTLSIKNSNCYTDNSLKTVGLPGVVGNAVNPATATLKVCTTSNTGDLVSAPVDGGLSDVNPTLFQGVNQAFQSYNAGTGNTSYFPEVTSIPSGVTIVPGAALTMGVPVTLNLYKALQAAQGLSTGSCALGSYTDACMPSLTKPVLTSLISGNITDWSALSYNGVTLKQAAINAGLITASFDTTVNFCQRVAGSGTAAAQYAYFLNAPGNSATTLPPTSGSQYGPYVYSLADGGNMEACLDDFGTGATTNAKDYTGTPLLTAPQAAWAIGQLSVDKNPTAGKAYRFIKINGVAPTLANVYNGAYDFVVESTWQYQTNPVQGRTKQQAIVKALITEAQTPNLIYTQLNATVNPVFAGGSGTTSSMTGLGVAGFAEPISNAVAVNSAYTQPNAFDPLNPVYPWSHALAGALDNGSFTGLNSSATFAPSAPAAAAQ